MEIYTILSGYNLCIAIMYEKAPHKCLHSGAFQACSHAGIWEYSSKK